MKVEIAKIRGDNLVIQGNLNKLTADNTLIHGNIDTLHQENSALNKKVDALNESVTNLQDSENKFIRLVERLTEKIDTGGDLVLKNQIHNLEKLHADTHIDMFALSDRLKNLESTLKQAPVSGIFTYIEEQENQSLFIEKVQEALAQEMTYAQIDEYLTNSLPQELDKIIKDHPALTKNYIRNLRR